MSIMSKKAEPQGKYFSVGLGLPITQPPPIKVIASRVCMPLLALLSREASLKTGLTPIDDERVIMALKYARGKLLDIGCGANNFVHSYPGEGVGVDVYPWEGVDKVIDSADKLPFKDGEFDTVSYIACLNHIPNRADSLKEAYRVTKNDGRVIVTMIPPLWGSFIHWLRFRNDPDQHRDIDHDHELMGMHPTHVRSLMKDAGFSNIRQRRFVFGINSIYIGDRT